MKCMTEEELVQLALRRTSKARTQGEAAKQMGVHRSHFVNFIAGRKRPGPRILKRLGMVQVVHYMDAPKKKAAAKPAAKKSSKPASKPKAAKKAKPAAKPRTKKAAKGGDAADNFIAAVS